MSGFFHVFKTFLSSKDRFRIKNPASQQGFKLFNLKF